MRSSHRRCWYTQTTEQPETDSDSLSSHKSPQQPRLRHLLPNEIPESSGDRLALEQSNNFPESSGDAYALRNQAKLNNNARPVARFDSRFREDDAAFQARYKSPPLPTSLTKPAPESYGDEQSITDNLLPDEEEIGFSEGVPQEAYYESDVDTEDNSVSTQQYEKEAPERRQNTNNSPTDSTINTQANDSTTKNASHTSKKDEERWSDRAQKNITNGKAWLKKRAGEAAAKKAEEKLAQAAVQQGIKQGAALLAEGFSGPVGWAIAALNLASMAVTISQSPVGQWIQYAVILILVLGLGFWLAVISLGMGYTAIPRSLGPAEQGGRAVIPATNPLQAAMAAADAGLTAGQGLENLIQAENQISQLLESNSRKLTTANVTKARQLLQKMAAIRQEIASYAYADDKAPMQDALKRYKAATQELAAIMQPVTGAGRQRVLDLITQGVIRTVNYKSCRPKRDIQQEPLAPNLFTTLAGLGDFAANHKIAVTITCIKTGHTSNAGSSQHESGEGMDVDDFKQNLSLTGEVVKYLYQNAETLGIYELIYNRQFDGRYYNIDSGRKTNSVFTGGHTDHIHVGVRP